jgi:hypothetical protein
MMRSSVSSTSLATGASSGFPKSLNRTVGLRVTTFTLDIFGLRRIAYFNNAALGPELDAFSGHFSFKVDYGKNAEFVLRGRFLNFSADLVDGLVCFSDVKHTFAFPEF